MSKKRVEFTVDPVGIKVGQGRAVTRAFVHLTGSERRKHYWPGHPSAPEPETEYLIVFDKHSVHALHVGEPSVGEPVWFEAAAPSREAVLQFQPAQPADKERLRFQLNETVPVAPSPRSSASVAAGAAEEGEVQAALWEAAERSWSTNADAAATLVRSLEELNESLKRAS